MKKVSKLRTPKIAYVFGDLSSGGHNLQAYKTIKYSGAYKNCIVVSVFDENGDSIVGEIEALGVKVIRMHLSTFGFLGGGANRLCKILKEFDCKIAHSNGLKSDLLAMRATKGTSIKHVITLHNYLKEDAYLRMNRVVAGIAVIVQKYVLDHSKYIIACSKTLKNQMLTDNSKINVVDIQNGVDLENYQTLDKKSLREEYGISNKKTIFISTGSMTPRKRISETANAFLKAELERESAELWFVGDGFCFEEYKKEYAGNSQIKFWGRRSDIQELLNISDYFVSSSESEGLPLAVLEAIAVGCKVYLSDIEPHKEILEEFVFAGEIYSLGDEGALANLFKKAMKVSETEECKISLEGTCFDINIMGERYCEYYNKIEKTI